MKGKEQDGNRKGDVVEVECAVDFDGNESDDPRTLSDGTLNDPSYLRFVISSFSTRICLYFRLHDG